MLRLETRPAPSSTFVVASPLIALAATVLIGVLLFVLLGKDPVLGLRMFFWEPIKSPYAWSEIGIKATPLILIALGLALCFRANVWNIGAEGQYILGAIFAGGIAMQATPDSPRAIVVVILLAGIVGGMVWAAIVALLKARKETVSVAESSSGGLISTALLSVGGASADEATRDPPV